MISLRFSSDFYTNAYIGPLRSTGATTQPSA